MGTARPGSTTESSRTSLELMEIEVEALFTHDAEGRIVANNEPDGDPAPCLFLGRTGSGNLWRVRHDVPENVARRVKAIVAAKSVSDDLRTESNQLDALMAALRLDHKPKLATAGRTSGFPLIFWLRQP